MRAKDRTREGGGREAMLKMYSKAWPANTHLVHKGKFHWTADLLFDWFGFGQTSKCVVN